MVESEWVARFGLLEVCVEIQGLADACVEPEPGLLRIGNGRAVAKSNGRLGIGIKCRLHLDGVVGVVA